MKERIKSIRKALGFTQQKFAKRLGVKQKILLLTMRKKTMVSRKAFFLHCPSLTRMNGFL